MPRWEYVSSRYVRGRHAYIYRDDALGVQLQLHERWTILLRRRLRLYFIDGVPRVFRSEASMLSGLADPLLARTGTNHSTYIDVPRPGGVTTGTGTSTARHP